MVILGKLLGLMGRIVKGCVRKVSLAPVSCILMYVYVAPPTPVGAWSMALGLRQRIEYSQCMCYNYILSSYFNESCFMTRIMYATIIEILPQSILLGILFIYSHTFSRECYCILKTVTTNTVICMYHWALGSCSVVRTAHT